MRAAISLMRSEDSLALRSMGMCTLRYLSLKPIVKPKVVQAGGLPAACLLVNHNVSSPLEMDLQTHIAGFLVSMAGLMSGLTLGLMSLDQVDIEVRAGGEVARVGSGGRRLQMQGCGGRQRQRQLPVFAVSGASAMQFQ